MTTAPWAAVALLALLVVPAAQAAFAVEPVDPQPGATVRTATPTLRLAFANGTADPETIEVQLDGQGFDEQPAGLATNATGVAFSIPAILALREGNHTFKVHAAGPAGAADYTLLFTVNLTIPPEPPKPVDMGRVVLLSSGGLLLLGGAAGAAYVYARKARNFTFKRHFLRHPEQIRFIALYIPSGAAVLLTLGALYASSTMAVPRFTTERILVAGAALAIGPFGLASARATAWTRNHERAFAQFLFELADAVRGGINPVKAVQELAKTGEGVLKKPLQRASDVLRLGRPMDEALRAMTQDMGSPLVSRYAALVGEASSMGGSVAGVLQRAAKDMDDLVKIKAERRRSLRTPVFTMYMAFGVMAVMILQIVSFAPNIGDLDMGVLTGGKAAAEVAKMPLALMQVRFFHLLLLNAAGAGLLVGSFTEGKVRNGLLHAIAMTAVAAFVYPMTL
jgi:archaellum biogenesis protein FlaJ (TadC family)